MAWQNGGGVMEHNKQYILPSRSTLHLSSRLPHLAHHTHLFSTLPYQVQMGLTVFLHNQPDHPPQPPTHPSSASQPPFAFFSFLPLASLVYDTPQILSLCGFWQGVRYQDESQFHQAKKQGLREREQARGIQAGLSLPPTAPFPLYSISCLFAWLIFTFLLACG